MIKKMDKDYLHGRMEKCNFNFLKYFVYLIKFLGMKENLKMINWMDKEK